MRTLDLFSGGGGSLLGGMLLNHRPVAYCETDKHCRRVLEQRIKDGLIPDVPIHGDIRTLDGKQFRGVELITAGPPCQPVSSAGARDGEFDPRFMLWDEVFRIVKQSQCPRLYVENVEGLLTLGMGSVLREIVKLGFDAEWGILSAADVGAPHLRERVWIMAGSKSGDTDGIALAELDGRTWRTPGGAELNSWPRFGSIRDGIVRRRPPFPVTPAEGERLPTVRAQGGTRPIGNFMVSITEALRRLTRSGTGLLPTLRASMSNGPSLREIGEGDPRYRIETTLAIIAAERGEPADGTVHPDFATWMMSWPRGWDHTEPVIREAVDDWRRRTQAETWFSELPDVPLLTTTAPNRSARLEAIGNGQVPLCHATAFRMLSARLERQELRHHEAAAAVPSPSDDQHAALVADLRANGLREAVALQDGRILDGRSRYLACLDLGIEPRFRSVKDEPSAFVISMNLARRHLTAGMRACIAAELVPAFGVDAKERQRAHRAKLPEAGRARDHAARLCAVSGRYVESAIRLRQSDADLFASVKAGTLSLADALRTLRDDEPEPGLIRADPVREIAADLAMRLEAGPSEARLIKTAIRRAYLAGKQAAE